MGMNISGGQYIKTMRYFVLRFLWPHMDTRHVPTAPLPGASCCDAAAQNPFCLPHSPLRDVCERLQDIAQSSIRIQKGDPLFEAGQPAHKLYLIRTGSFKTILGSPDGRQQILGFHFPSEILGLESFATRTYSTDAVALEDGEASAIDMVALELCARQLPVLQHQIHCLIGNCLENAQRTQFALGSMHAAERLAYFLLDLSDRFKARGLPDDALNLSMSREELGSFLGLKLETISRLMTHFDEIGLLQVHLRQVRILDRARLSRLLDQTGDAASLNPRHA